MLEYWNIVILSDGQGKRCSRKCYYGYFLIYHEQQLWNYLSYHHIDICLISCCLISFFISRSTGSSYISHVWRLLRLNYNVLFYCKTESDLSKQTIWYQYVLHLIHKQQQKQKKGILQILRMNNYMLMTSCNKRTTFLTRLHMQTSKVKGYVKNSALNINRPKKIKQTIKK